MATPPRFRGPHGLARWLAAVLLLFEATQALNGTGGVQALQPAGRAEGIFAALHLAWFGVSGWTGMLLVAVTGLLLAVASDAWRSLPGIWPRWWSLACGLLIVAEWAAAGGSRAGSGWVSVLGLSLTTLLFLLAVTMMICTGQDWRTPVRAVEDFQRPGIFALGGFLTAGLVVQNVVGGAVHTRVVGVAPHLLGTLVVTPLLVCLVALVLRRHPEVPGLRRPALCLSGLLSLQMAMGAWSYMTVIQRPPGFGTPPDRELIAGDLHVIAGAVLAAVSLWLTLRARKHLTARVISTPPLGGAIEA